MSQQTFNQVYAIGVTEEKKQLHLLQIPRRSVGPNDVYISIEYCGICHSDLHHCRQEWGETKKPSVPGHEIIGTVTQVGANVTKFKTGDVAGVGCFVDSCRSCIECSDELIQYCVNGTKGTYGSPLTDGTSHTMGGYSQAIVVDENYVLRIPGNLDKAAAAPLLCAGITVWSPIKHYGVKKGDAVAVLGLGGLGHMAVKLASALGANVTVLSRSPSKSDDAIKLGAKNVLITSDAAAFKAATRTFDFIIDTVSAKHDLPAYLNLLPFSLIPRRIKVGGSLVGGIKETQEMLDFCSEHGIVSDVEVIKVSYAEKAWERMLASDVKFRFVIDIANSLDDKTVVE
ncbi:UNVERIFIED_CONTAM: hypothetical protein HDU68_010324 [Siphonaria sp. JEL0065]|nr:hypothetical protein HDU68_010324 [Siphonaria sp. JEL0065]